MKKIALLLCLTVAHTITIFTSEPTPKNNSELQCGACTESVRDSASLGRHVHKAHIIDKPKGVFICSLCVSKQVKESGSAKIRFDQIAKQYKFDSHQDRAMHNAQLHPEIATWYLDQSLINRFKRQQEERPRKSDKRKRTYFNLTTPPAPVEQPELVDTLIDALESRADIVTIENTVAPINIGTPVLPHEENPAYVHSMAMTTEFFDSITKSPLPIESTDNLVTDITANYLDSIINPPLSSDEPTYELTKELIDLFYSTNDPLL